MEFSLSEIVSSIGTSVQTARYALEDRAVELYFKGGYEERDEHLVPITKTVRLPAPSSESGKKNLDIPLTALFSHKTMALHKVDVNLRLKPCEQNHEILFTMGGNHTSDDADNGQYVDLSLSFSLDDTPEGMARLNQENVKRL